MSRYLDPVYEAWGVFDKRNGALTMDRDSAELFATRSAARKSVKDGDYPPGVVPVVKRVLFKIVEVLE